ncbi:MAG TPA: hypothetical protein PLP17_08640 [Oligoflexia bacterium]|nr:hypothetical protein [Oligoflexia bacterium]
MSWFLDLLVGLFGRVPPGRCSIRPSKEIKAAARTTAGISSRDPAAAMWQAAAELEAMAYEVRRRRDEHTQKHLTAKAAVSCRADIAPRLPSGKSATSETLETQETTIVSQINSARERLQRADTLIAQQKYSINQRIVTCKMQAQEIISALEKRLQTVHEILAAPGETDYSRAISMFNQDLTIGRDSINTVLRGQPVLLPPSQWQPALETLLVTIERELLSFVKNAQRHQAVR